MLCLSFNYISFNTKFFLELPVSQHKQQHPGFVLYINTLNKNWLFTTQHISVKDR